MPYTDKKIPSVKLLNVIVPEKEKRNSEPSGNLSGIANHISMAVHIP